MRAALAILPPKNLQNALDALPDVLATRKHFFLEGIATPAAARSDPVGHASAALPDSRATDLLVVGGHDCGGAARRANGAGAPFSLRCSGGAGGWWGWFDPKQQVAAAVHGPGSAPLADGRGTASE